MGGDGFPSKIFEREIVLTDSKSIASVFNNFFANIGNNLAATRPSLNISPIDFMPQKLSHSLFFHPITSQKIEAEINKLNSTKAIGPFSIPTDILELIKVIISEPLKMIFNSSLINGIKVLTALKLPG